MGSSEFISSIVSKDSGEEVHSENIWVIPVRGIEEDSNVQIMQFIVSHSHY